MPVCRIQTNASLSSEQVREANATLSQAVSEGLGKSIDYVMTRIDAGVEMTFGGTSAPCAYCELASLGLEASQIPDLSRSLTECIATALSVPPDRVYIRFDAPPRSHFAFNGKPFE